MRAFISKFFKKLPLLAFDIGAIPVAWYGAYGFRYNLQDSPVDWMTVQSFEALLLLMGVQMGAYYYFKVYRGLWRYTSLNDVLRIIKAIVCASVAVIPLLYLCSLVPFVPRSVLPLYALTLCAMLCSGRMLMRWYRDKQMNFHHGLNAKRVLIIGAGQAGESLLRDLVRTPQYIPVAVLDDDMAKHFMEIHGVEVTASIEQLPEVVESQGIDIVFIAIPTANSSVMRRIVNLCNRAHVAFRTLPNIVDLAEGKVALNDLREVKLEDLLGRDQVYLEWDKIYGGIANKRVLVTGGGGSIGLELCRQLLSLKPSSLMIVDHCEFNLYQAEMELTSAFPEAKLSIALNSVTDELAMDALFHDYRPELVFHAAAYKHVPLLEGQIRVAVQNNILGTQIVAQLSAEVDAEKFVLISTDKAVNPTNVMGATKRAAEIYCQNLNELSRTAFITVRFGNVLGSAGSVVPLFRQQIERGGPVTVTHPEVLRYFMTIPEACQLILQAMVNGCGGEIFVLDMGEPIKIAYLAEQMIRLSGKIPYEDVAIEYTGLRAGEKLFEELFHDAEALEKTAHDKLFKAQFRKIIWSDLLETLHLLQEAARMQRLDELHVLLKSLVPEFQGHLVLERLAE